MRNLFFPAVLSAAFVLTAAESPYKWSKAVPIGAGISYAQCRLTEPKPLRITAVSVPLKNVGFTMTGRCAGWGQPFGAPAGEVSVQNADGTLFEPAAKRTKRESVTQFFRSMKEAFAKDESKGKPLFAFCGRGTDRPYYKDFADPEGIYILGGQIVSDDIRRRDGVFVVRKNGAASIERKLMPAEYGDVQFAISGKTFIRENGKYVVDPSRKTPGPRLAIGLSADKAKLFVVSADNGETPRYNDGGATYQDLDAIFENFGVTDALALDLGNSTAIVTGGPDGGELQLNPFKCNDGDHCRNSVNVGVYAAVRKPATASVAPAKKEDPKKEEAEKPKGPETIEARIQRPVLSVIRDRKTGETALKGQVKVTVSSDLPRFKQPVLALYALFDVGGAWKYYDVVLTDQKVGWGFCAEQAKPYTPKQVSAWRTEVGAAEWKSLTFGDLKRGFFRGCHLSPEAKLMCWRLELWQNQGLVTTLESDMKTPKRLGVPDDWYVKGKYTGKMTYYWTPPKEKE